MFKCNIKEHNKILWLGIILAKLVIKIVFNLINLMLGVGVHRLNLTSTRHIKNNRILSTRIGNIRKYLLRLLVLRSKGVDNKVLASQCLMVRGIRCIICLLIRYRPRVWGRAGWERKKLLWCSLSIFLTLNHLVNRISWGTIVSSWQQTMLIIL